MDQPSNQTSGAILLAPVIFIAHFLEESPGFVAWFNAHVTRGITSQLFWQVNITALVITIILVVMERLSRSSLSLTLVMAWLGFLMFTNALFHVAAALIDRRYVPGLLTAIVLYIPYYSWLFGKALKSERVPPAVLVVTTLFASLPMALHGYLIVFRGSRLF